MKKTFSLFAKCLLSCFLFVVTVPGFSQLQDEMKMEKPTSKPAELSLGADLVSRYIWRGKDFGNSPAIQPNVAFSVAGFKIGGVRQRGQNGDHRGIGDRGEAKTVVGFGRKQITAGSGESEREIESGWLAGNPPMPSSVIATGVRVFSANSLSSRSLRSETAQNCMPSLRQLSRLNPWRASLVGF